MGLPAGTRRPRQATVPRPVIAPYVASSLPMAERDGPPASTAASTRSRNLPTMRSCAHELRPRLGIPDRARTQPCRWCRTRTRIEEATTSTDYHIQSLRSDPFLLLGTTKIPTTYMLLHFPFLPKILLDICHALFPPPTPPPPEERVTCRAPLAKRFVPVCGSFLTNSSVSSPSSECCYRVSSFIATPTQFCLCHIANGDARRVGVLLACTDLTEGMIYQFCDVDGDIYSKFLRVGSSNNIRDPPYIICF
uniref:Bifunctional inhibitor/plant lipid transfer protein/seed storage helical domain-containing protein n=1 Tax=Setaria italica TaxID=4555 RepID=K3XSL0_SETIT